MSSATARLLALWQRLSTWPGGKTLFRFILSRAVPYSGTVSPRITVLEPGYVRIEMRDRRRIRNHLNSVHAIALANVAELASGLAMSTGLPSNVRGIVVKLQIEYLKKARGTLVAESRVAIPDVMSDTEYDVTSHVTDSGGDIVARATVTWRLRRESGGGAS